MLKKTIFKIFQKKENKDVQIIKALLSWAQLEWQDIIVTKDNLELINKEHNIHVDNLPLVQYKLESYSNMKDIISFMASKFKLHGSDDQFEKSMLFFDEINEIYRTLLLVIGEEGELDIESRIKTMKELTETNIPECLQKLELEYKGREWPRYFFGETISLIDFVIGTYLHNLIFSRFRNDLLMPILNRFPKIKDLVVRLVNDELKSYFNLHHLHESPI